MGMVYVKMFYGEMALFSGGMASHLNSAAWRSGLEGRFYDDHDRKVNGSTPNLISLLRPWKRCFTMILCLVESG